MHLPDQRILVALGASKGFLRSILSLGIILGATQCQLRGADEGGVSNQNTNQLRLQVELQDGSRVSGVPSGTNLAISYESAKMTIALSLLSVVKVEGSPEKASLEFENGDRMAGALSGEGIELEAALGKVKVPFKQIRSIRVMRQGTVRDGLMVHFSFDEENDIFVKDNSGEGHEGALVGVRWKKDGVRGGGCLTGRGTPEIRLNPIPDMRLQEFTIALWIQRENVAMTSDGGYMAAFVGMRGKKEVFGLESDGRLFASGMEKNRRPIEAKVSDLNWHYVAMVADGKTATFYLDGEECGTANYDEIIDCREGFSIGSVGNKVGYPFLGSMDEIMIFKRALSGEEVKRIYRSLK